MIQAESIRDVCTSGRTDASTNGSIDKLLARSSGRDVTWLRQLPEVDRDILNTRIRTIAAIARVKFRRRRPGSDSVSRSLDLCALSVRGAIVASLWRLRKRLAFKAQSDRGNFSNGNRSLEGRSRRFLRGQSSVAKSIGQLYSPDDRCDLVTRYATSNSPLVREGHGVWFPSLVFWGCHR